MDFSVTFCSDSGFVTIGLPLLFASIKLANISRVDLFTKLLCEDLCM